MLQQFDSNNFLLSFMTLALRQESIKSEIAPLRNAANFRRQSIIHIKHLENEIKKSEIKAKRTTDRLNSHKQRSRNASENTTMIEDKEVIASQKSDAISLIKTPEATIAISIKEYEDYCKMSNKIAQGKKKKLEKLKSITADIDKSVALTYGNSLHNLNNIHTMRKPNNKKLNDVYGSTCKRDYCLYGSDRRVLL